MKINSQNTAFKEIPVTSAYLASHFINGKIVSSHSSRTQNLYNPATGQVTGQVALGNAADVHAAVTAASQAFPAWSATPPNQRTGILFKYNHILQQHLNELAELITGEHGKTLADARGSLERGMAVLEYACGAPNLLLGRYAADVSHGIDSYSLHQPLGVCVGITPFNFPAMIGLWMFPLAIACGNTFVLKPSEKDPSCGLRLVELLHEAGLPPGVVNVIQGDKEAVDALLVHPEVKAISFVGSTPVAEYVYHTATKHGKRVQAMGGAKNHALVMPDANLDQAADAIVGAAYGSAGERCMAISVVIAVGEQTTSALLQKLIPKVQALNIGDGLSSGVEMGPLITAQHREKVKSYIELGLQEGAKLMVDGRGYEHPQLKQGFFLGGCLFANVTPQMRIYREEIFGPVLCVLQAPNFEAALAWINAHEYGNGTAIFTRDAHFAHQFASQVQIGMVGINVPIPVPPAYHSFGGWKRSLFGDIGIHGMEGVSFYTHLKTVTQRWPAEEMTMAEFHMKG